MAAASVSRKRSASSSGRMATPLSLTALSCWKRLSERGVTWSRMVAIDASGTSLPPGPVTWMSLSWSGLSRSAAQQLRDDLVAAAGHREAVDEVAAHRGGQVLPHLLQVQPQGRHLVAIELDLGLRLVDLDVDERREGEEAAPGRLLLELPGEAEDLGRLGRGGDHELDREVAAAGERGRQDREGLDARGWRPPAGWPRGGSGRWCASARPRASAPRRRSRRSGR